MSLVLSETERGVTTLTLNDDENRNALGPDIIEELMAGIDAADADPAVRVIVLTNNGSVFCAGANLKTGNHARAGAPSGMDLFSRFRKSPKPFVGKISGHCVAGGMGLAAAMDISVALDTAKFGFTEVRIGVAPAMISVLCLPKMRPADAAAAFLRGNRFLAPEAVRLGLINEAVGADDLNDAVDAIVDDLRLAGPNAIAATKSLLTTVPGMSIDDAFEWTARLSADLFGQDEAREGMAAFREKRPPSWVAEID